MPQISQVVISAEKQSYEYVSVPNPGTNTLIVKLRLSFYRIILNPSEQA